MLQAVHAAAFMIDSHQRRGRGNVAQLIRQRVDLIEAFDVPLKNEKAAGTDGVEEKSGFPIQFVSLESQDEQLPDFLFQRKVILHGFYVALFFSSANTRNASSGVRFSTSTCRSAIRSSSSRAVKSES